MYSVKYKDKSILFEIFLNKNKYYKPTVFLGDSIIEAIDWKELFSNETLLNRGIGSDTVSGVINRLESITKLNPSTVFIMIGINDISLGGDTKAMFKKYQYLINTLKKQNIRIVILSTLYTQVSKYNSKVEKFNILLKKLSLNKNIIYVNLNEELSLNKKLKDIYSLDGVHLNYKGYLMIKEKLNPLMEK